MNSAFAFFGKGLFASAYVEFDYVNNEINNNYKRAYSDKFSNNNARIRAAALGTTLSFRLASPLRLSIDKLNLLNATGTDSTQIRILEHDIVTKEKRISKILKQLGEATKNPTVSTSSFNANFYYILPNTIHSNAEERRLYQIYSYTFYTP
ncbi:hypothetical protein PQ465_04385 [Sphingobacterium oryzagri]|uniref:Uncharacterized protein n=1 Tax=Sphingobacterium oryzagri TaxID=3025669 RepID=A0ABY7WJC6_9SPHI|nr:hypothetical protein [Sphingobacterium sp. KACC 22765]WDF69620.1 hypothetical protein PQ465_04385 [Sphingobacterium sp. KACC 22765]